MADDLERSSAVRWMGQLARESERFGRRRLGDIVWPMTRGSATEGLTSEALLPGECGVGMADAFEQSLLRNMASSKAQADTFLLPASATQRSHATNPITGTTTARSENTFLADQLLRGVRAFDLRLRMPADTVGDAFFGHGPLVWRGRLIASLADALDRFWNTEAARGELVLLRLWDLRSPCTVEQWRALLTNMDTVVGRERFCSLDQPASRTYDEVVSAPIIVLVDIDPKIFKILSADIPWLHAARDEYDDDAVACAHVGWSLRALRNYCRDAALRPKKCGVFRQLQLTYQPRALEDALRATRELRDLRARTTETDAHDALLGCLCRSLAEANFDVSLVGVNVVSFDFYSKQITRTIAAINRCVRSSRTVFSKKMRP